MDYIDLTRYDLPNLIGTLQESLRRSLTQCKGQGCIETDKRNIYIKDSPQLEQLLKVKIDYFFTGLKVDRRPALKNDEHYLFWGGSSFLFFLLQLNLLSYKSPTIWRRR